VKDLVKELPDDCAVIVDHGGGCISEAARVRILGLLVVARRG